MSTRSSKAEGDSYNILAHHLICGVLWIFFFFALSYFLPFRFFQLFVLISNSFSEKEAKPAGIQYHCDYCRRDISTEVRIKCAAPECKDFDLCVHCFADGTYLFSYLLWSSFSPLRLHVRPLLCISLIIDLSLLGVKVYPHEPSHPYRVMEHVTTPIFEEEWGADEEFLLLEAIELFG